MSLISAKKVSRLGYKPSLIKAIVRAQIDILSAKIQRAEKKWGINMIIHVLPEIFDIPGLSKENAQKLIYSQIIIKCRDAGYKVKLRLNAIPENADTEEKKKPRNILAVIWVSDLSEAELQTMDQVIEDAINMHITPSATSE
jgi:hypothetical protein